MQSIRQLEKALDVSTKRVDELCMENEKLRGLVLTLYMCDKFLCVCCKHCNENTCDFDAENELRKLGIEQ